MKIIHFLIPLAVFFVASLGYGQQTKDKPFVVQDDVSACESNPVGFAYVARDATKEDARVFVIFHAGSKETSTVNVRRFNYVKRNYLQRWATTNKLMVVYALGEKTFGNGRIEFYVGGRLAFVIMAPKNMTPCLDCCGDIRVVPKNLIVRRSRKRNGTSK